jgi:molecular chaperone GrpE
LTRFEFQIEKIMAEENMDKVVEVNAEEVKQDTPKTDEAKVDAAEQEEVVEDTGSKKKKSKKEKKKSELEELGLKLADIQDKHLRLQAEFDNFRRRTMKEKVDLIKNGGESVLINILPVIDDFERALDSLKDVSEDDAGKQGTTLIYTKFEEFLKQNNVKEIDALHQDFDVDLHEALTKIPAPDEKLKGKVVDVIQKGYLLNEKVIRFAKVVIGE